MAVKRKAQQVRDEALRDGEWNCAKCSAKNYNARVSCYKCAFSKRDSEIQLKGKAALDWECYKCKANNFSFRSSCFKCSITKFESDDIKAQREGVPWICRFCEVENRVSNSNCFKCKRPQDLADVLPPRRSAPRPVMMGNIYPDQRMHNMGPSAPPSMAMSFAVEHRLLPKPFSRPVSPLNKSTNLARPLSPLEGSRDWQCLLCSTFNALERGDCYKCTTPRGQIDPSPSVHSRIGRVNIGHGTKDGDWKCPGCNFDNFKHRAECLKCKEKKPGEDVGLSITINNDQSKPSATVCLDHSTSKDEPSPIKRRKMDYGEKGPAPDVRHQWGSDWTCGYCRVDIFPSRTDCFKCGRHRDECELLPDRAPRMAADMGPRDMDPRYMHPRDISPRFDSRERFGPDPRDRFGPDPRDRFGPDPRDRPGPPDGFTCSCGNFNRLNEPLCVKCGRPNDRGPAMRRDGPPGHPMWHSRGRVSPHRGVGRSPPRFYNDAPRGSHHIAPRQVNKVALAKKAAAQSKKGKAAKKNASGTLKDTSAQKTAEDKKKNLEDWMCKDCTFVNYNGREKCRKCKKKRSEVEDKEAVLPKRENAGGPKDWGDKPIAGVLDEYMALYAEHESNPDKKFVEGQVNMKQLFKAKRIANRILTKAQKKDVQDDTDKAKNVFDTLVKLHRMVHLDVKSGDGGWPCVAEECDAFNFKNRTVCFKCAAEKPASLDDTEEAEKKNDGGESAEPTAGSTQEMEVAGEQTKDDEDCAEAVNEVTEPTNDVTEPKDDVTEPETDVAITESAVDFKTDY